MQVSQEVLTILSELHVNGTEVRIPTALPRPHYLKVNKVLEALGGTWSRKARAHVFGFDAQPRLDLVMMTGKVETGQDVGWFPTPAALAKQIVAMADIRGGDLVLEPSAGLGALAFAALDDYHCEVVAIERDVDRRRRLCNAEFRYANRLRVVEIDDFMDYGVDPEGVIPFPDCAIKFDRVVMNPPFCKVGAGDHLDHVQHAFSLLRRGGVLVAVMPASVEFRRDRRYAEFRAWVEDAGTIEPLPAGSFKESGTGVNTCVVRMEK